MNALKVCLNLNFGKRYNIAVERRIKPMTGRIVSVKPYSSISLRALALGALMLSACAGAGSGTVRTDAAASGVDSESRPMVINDEVLEMEKKYYVAGVIDTYNSLASEPARQRVFRDEVIDGRIYVIDYYYSQFRNEMRGVKPDSNIVTDIAVLGLDAADAINPAKRAKDILLAISGGLTGPDTSVDKEDFYEEALPALISKMDSLRLERLVLIRQRMRYGTQGDNPYTLGAAMIDVNNYFQAGTLSGAILGITKSSGVAANEAEKVLGGMTR